MGLDDPRYARDITFPLRFDADCDLGMDENEKVIEHSLIMIIFTRKGSMILFRRFGSDIESTLFDLMDPDDAATLALDTSLRVGIDEFEDRVFLDLEGPF